MSSVFIPILLGIIQINRLKKYLRLILLFLLFSASSDVVTKISHELRDYAWPIYGFLEFILISLAYKSAFKSHVVNKLILLAIAMYCVYAINFYISKQHFYAFDFELRTISVYFFICLAGYSFYFLLRDNTGDAILTNPFFWMNAAILLYFSGILFLLTAINIYGMDNVYQLYSPINNSLNTIKNLMLGVAFYLNLRSSKKPNTF